MADYGHGDLSWFKEARFGMFIHWGLYSLAARCEWIQSHESISNEVYRKYFDHFDPDLFDPKAWARAAKEAGMKYFVITTKHHEGFCLFDTQYTDYKVTNTAAGRDLLREVIDAFRAEGLRIGLYYSLIDWHHPDFIHDSVTGPYRFIPAEEHRKLNAGRDMKRYAEYMRNQVTELLTNYGKIDIIWFDYSYPDKDEPDNPEKGKSHTHWESEKLIRLVRSLQPDVVVDNRLDLPGSGDIVTPEQYTPDAEPVAEDGTPLAWEGCHTFSGAWGYHRDETTWKSADQCIKLLIDHVSRNGNLLMNVGPTARGTFDARALERLADYGKWMRVNSRSIYGCGKAPAEFAAPADCRYTWNPKTGRLYLHIYSWPFSHLHLPGLAGKVRYAQFLHDASEIQFCEAAEGPMNAATPQGGVTLKLPVVKPDVTVPVIELFLSGKSY